MTWRQPQLSQDFIFILMEPLVPKFAGSNPAEAVGFLRVNKIPQHVGGHGGLSVVTCVLSGRGLFDELITRAEESYRLWCVVECDLETS